MINRIRENYTAHYEARLAVLVVLQRLALFVGIAFGVGLLWIGSYVSAAITICCLALLEFTVHLRRQGEALLASTLLAIVFLVEPTAVIILSGGMQSPYIVWLGVPIFAAGGLLGGRAALVAATCAVIALMSLLVLDGALGTLNELPSRAYASMRLFSFGVAAVLASALAWVVMSTLERESEAAQKSALEATLRAEELRQAEIGMREQIRARDKLYAVIAHELRMPAATLKMLFDDSAQVRPENPNRCTINDLLERMLSVMDDMRLAREPEQLGHAPRIRARASGVISQAVRMADRFVSESGLTVRVRLNSMDEIPVEIPERVLRQITMKLVKNCAIHAGAEHLEIGVDWQRDGDSVQYTIRFADDGCGVSPVDQGALFEGLIRGDSAAESGGVGLRTCRDYAQNVLAGDLTYMTSTWGGAEFVLVARFKVASEERGDAEAGRKSAEPLRHARVLLAEDSEVLRVLTVKLLEQRGARVTSACDGQEALQLIENESFDLVVVDLHMPKVDGLELTKRLREGGARLPIIGLTAAFGDDAVLIRRAGATAVLTKPLDVERIEDILEAHAARSGAVGNRSVAA